MASYPWSGRWCRARLTTVSESVPPTTEPFVGSDAPSATRRKRRWIVLGVLFGVVGLLVVGSMMVPVPYYRVAPGQVRVTEPLVTVDGATTYVDDSDGAIGFTTIAFGPVTAFGAFLGWLDPHTEILAEREALGGQDRDENAELNRLMMDRSQQLGAAVALERLGYEVTFEGTGAMVVEIVPDSAAEAVLELGDTIVGIDGETVLLSEELVSLVGEYSPGDAVELEVEGTDGTSRIESVELGERPDDPSMPLLGVATMTRDFDYVFPFTVTIDAGDIGGPSAGLAFTLTILDMLTPGELTGGRQVAVTGTIRTDGSVGAVGGVQQKAVAAERAGFDLFIVPTSELDSALLGAGSMPVIAVDDLDGALEALASVGGDVPGTAELASPRDEASAE